MFPPGWRGRLPIFTTPELRILSCLGTLGMKGPLAPGTARMVSVPAKSR
jgi:hypothetical protein